MAFLTKFIDTQSIIVHFIANYWFIAEVWQN